MGAQVRKVVGYVKYELAKTLAGASQISSVRASRTKGREGDVGTKSGSTP